MRRPGPSTRGRALDERFVSALLELIDSALAASSEARGSANARICAAHRRTAFKAASRARSLDSNCCLSERASLIARLKRNAH
jgi:hypothetical protein